MRLGEGFYARSVHDVARELVGCVVRHGGTAGRIVETESYHMEEPACHAFAGVTERTTTLFGPPGRAYVYFSYGIHSLLNAVAEDEGVGAAVLIRALEPVDGIELMRERRGLDDLRLLCSGPGRLGEALGVTHALNGQRLDRKPFRVVPRSEDALHRVAEGTRIGISKAREMPWRFVLHGSKFLSKPMRPA